MMPEKPSPEQLREIFTNFNGTKVLVVGDVMLDAYWWGSVNRISPEAPVPIVLVKKKEHRLGGAANVAMNLANLGADTTLCSVIGRDLEGAELKKLLKERGISCECLLESAVRPTTVKTRVIGNNHQLLRVDNEMDVALELPDEQALRQQLEGRIAKADVVVFEDYDKGLLTPPLIEWVIEHCKKVGVPVVVDPKRKNFLAYRGATLFKPNLKELQEGLKVELSRDISREELHRIAEQLRETLDLEVAMITLSERGVYMLSDEEEHHIPAHLRNIYDVSGAGDTVSAVCALTLAQGLNLWLVGELSNLAGGLVCESVGVVPVDKEAFFQECMEIFHGRGKKEMVVEE